MSSSDTLGLDSADGAPDPTPVIDATGKKIFGTTGVPFWGFLSAVMIKGKPTSILELGSGRSTTFLADYAARAKVRCVSVEHSEEWHRKTSHDLQLMSVKGNHVHHVPLVRTKGSPPWYDMEAMRRLIGGVAFDFVFIDGPIGGARRNPGGQALLAEVSETARFILVDDVHRAYNLDFFNRLAQDRPADGRFFYHYAGNMLAISVTEEWRDLVRSAFEFMEIAYTSEPPANSVQEGDDDE